MKRSIRHLDAPSRRQAGASLVRFVVIGSLLVVAGGCATQKELIQKEPVDLAVEHLLQALDEAIETAYQRYGDELGLTLTEVSVELKTEVEDDQGEDVTVSILEIEASEEESFTQTLTLTLDPPDKSPGTDPTSASDADPRLVKRLDEGIDAAILAVRGAKSGLERLHPDGIPLETKKIQVAVAFALTTSGEGLPTISILGIDLTSSRTRARAHAVTLTFEVD